MCRAAFAHEAYHGMCSTCAYRRPALSMQAITHATCYIPSVQWLLGAQVAQFRQQFRKWPFAEFSLSPYKTTCARSPSHTRTAVQRHRTPCRHAHMLELLHARMLERVVIARVRAAGSQHSPRVRLRVSSTTSPAHAPIHKQAARSAERLCDTEMRAQSERHV